MWGKTTRGKSIFISRSAQRENVVNVQKRIVCQPWTTHRETLDLSSKAMPSFSATLRRFSTYQSVAGEEESVGMFALNVRMILPLFVFTNFTQVDERIFNYQINSAFRLFVSHSSTPRLICWLCAASPCNKINQRILFGWNQS